MVILTKSNMKRSESESSVESANEAKRPKMDVPPPSCLRTRRPGGRGRGGTKSDNAEDRLGSLSGQLINSSPVSARLDSEAQAVKNQESSAVKNQESSIKKNDVQNNQVQNTADINQDTNRTQAVVHANAASKPAVKQSKSPKMLLNEHYARQQIKSVKNQYTTIQHDKMVKFLSVFICPVTGERFMSGRLKGADFLQENGVVWYGELFFGYIVPYDLS